MPEEGGSRPPYREVAAALRAQIETGALPPGARLPSAAEIGARWGVSHVTAGRAIRELRDAGLVDEQPGRGLFVRTPPRLLHVSANYLTGGASWASEAERQGHHGTERRIHVGPADPPPAVAAALGAEVIERRRVMLLDGDPVQLARSYYPRALAEGTELGRRAALVGGTLAALARLGVAPTRFREEWRFRLPSEVEAAALGLPAGVPVAEMIRVSYAPAGPVTPAGAVSVDVTVMGGDRHVIVNDYPATSGPQ
jgi:GntR family transcriptional regulator